VRKVARHSSQESRFLQRPAPVEYTDGLIVSLLAERSLPLRRGDRKPKRLLRICYDRPLTPVYERWLHVARAHTIDL
jgi:hypothetical protein